MAVDNGADDLRLLRELLSALRPDAEILCFDSFNDGLRIVAAHAEQDGQTMVVGLANGTVGYIATDKALDEGSYETRLCRHVRSPKGTGKLWADTAVAGLSELLKKQK